MAISISVALILFLRRHCLADISAMMLRIWWRDSRWLSSRPLSADQNRIQTNMVFMETLHLTRNPLVLCSQRHRIWKGCEYIHRHMSFSMVQVKRQHIQHQLLNVQCFPWVLFCINKTDTETIYCHMFLFCWYVKKNPYYSIQFRAF